MKDRLKRQSFNQRNKKSFSSSFRAPKKENKIKVFLIIGLSSILIIVLLFLYFIFFSSFFKIKEIKVEGIDNKNEQIEMLVEEQINGGAGLFSQKNIIIFNEKKLLKTLSDFNFAEISLKKNIWKRHLILKINEREEALLYLEDSKYYFLDKFGNIIRLQDSCDRVKNNVVTKTVELASSTSTSTATSTEILKTTEQDEAIDMANCLKFDDKFKQENFLPLIENNSGNNKIGDNNKNAKLEEEYLNFAFKLYSDLNNSSEFGFKKIVLDEEYNTIKVKLNNNLDVYLSLKNDYSEQMSKFFTITRERASELSGKKYIDLRYGDKIFYY